MTDIYQQIILDHFKNPRRYFSLDEHDVHLSGDNALCGDAVSIYLKLDNQQRIVASFTGKGCAISQASASIMIEAIHGLTITQAEALIAQFNAMFDQSSSPATPPSQPAPVADEAHYPLSALAMVHRYPMRIKCARLAWGVMASGLVQLAGMGG